MTIRDLSAYVPRWVSAALRDQGDDADAPFARRVRAAVLFLDIAGFTETTDRLAERGPWGAEELSNVLNDCFAALTKAIEDYGGDIVAFAGDGILALWDDNEALACQLAAQCGLALQDVMQDWAQARGRKFGQRICIDFGDVYRCKLGGFEGRWRYVVVGAPIQSVGAAYRKAHIGEVLLCSAAWRSIAEICQGRAVDDVFRLGSLTQQIASPVRDALPPPSTSKLSRIVSPVLLNHLPLDEGKWLAELRNVTILYLNLLDFSFDDGVPAWLQNVVVQIQRVAVRFEGHLHVLLMDDKGLSAAMAFGLPPLAHEDDSLRAVEAAFAIRRFLTPSIRSSAGIASGRLFCGEYGGTTRREYCVLGPAVNIAARLMEAAGGDILCDNKTAQAAKERISFSVLPALHLKGRSEPLTAFSPIATLNEPKKFQHITDLVGRAHERQQLSDALAELQRCQGKVVVVQGEAGIGKSRLLAEIIDDACQANIRTLRGFATAIERNTPYFAWRSILIDLLDVGTQYNSALITSVMHQRLSGDARLVSWIPLVGDIIPFDGSETELTAQMTGSARSASIEELTVALLRSSAQGRPILLAFEDLHWFDSASSKLLVAVARRLPALLLVVTTRPPGNAADAEIALTGLERVEKIDVGPLARDAVDALVRRRLGAVEPPAALLTFVYDHAGGNPFYCEELLFALRDTGAITVTRGTCRIVRDLNDITNQSLSANLEGAIVSRVDALPLDLQLVLKVASAIGSSFTKEILLRLYPRSVTATELGGMLDRLVECDVIRPRDGDLQRTYEFRHAISREVTYSLLSFAQRRGLHKTIAGVLESVNQDKLESFYGQLAQHWELADDKVRASEYLELSAEQAIRNHANQDAIRQIAKVLEWAEGSIIAADAWRQSGWEVIAGDGHNEMADYDEAYAHYSRAMGLLGQSLAKQLGERVVSLGKNIMIQCAFRLITPRPEKMSQVSRLRCKRAAHIRERVSEQHFFRNEWLAVLDETLGSLNLAERCGAVAEAISGYNALALGLGLSGLLTPARYYSRRALSLAQERGAFPDAARAHLVAAVLGYGLGEWDFTEKYARGAISLYQQLGDRSRWQAPLTILIFSSLLRGDISKADRLLIDFEATISPESSNQTKAWFLAARVLTDLMRGETDPAKLRQLRELADSKQVRADQLLCLGIVASAYLQRKDISNALEAAESGLAVLQESSVVWASYVYGVAGVTDVLLARWAMVGQAKSKDPHAGKALSACKHAVRVTRTSPVGKPFTFLLKGRVAYLSGDLVRARREWQRAAAAAERLQMRREVGLALYDIGRTTAPDDPDRPTYLARAAEIFEMLGASAALADVHRAIAM